MRSFRWSWFAAAVAGLAAALSSLVPARTPTAPVQPAAATSTAVHLKLTAGAHLTAFEGHRLAPLFDRRPGAIAADRASAMARTGHQAPDLAAWYRIDTAGADQARALAARLRDDPAVVSAFVAPVAEPAVVRAMTAPRSSSSCPIKTPSYLPYQGYLGVAPAGVDAPAAWARPGGRGEGVSFADVEGGWNFDHEDIPGDRMELVGGRPIGDRGWEAHGTAVVGVVAARDNDIGMVGITPDVDRVLVSSIGGSNPAAAIDRAQAALAPGDVLLIELHAIGPRRRFLPMEFWDDVYDAIRLATDRGVIVVEAAGNGGEDLDHRAYRGKLDRTKRDSGAIMVGAGAPARAGYVDRSRLDFSNYGTRVDVQGWGYRVATFDYGDLQECAGTERTYTDQFSGTSSASPVVTGAAIAVQGIYKALHGTPMAPKAVRALLRETGTPQADGPHGTASATPIGPRPDLARAIQRL